MILYHFTALANVEAIQREGLRATRQKPIIGATTFVAAGLSVVYLTDTPTTANTDAEREAIRHGSPEETVVSKRWLRYQDSEPLARFMIRLPSSDRKLKQYGRWHHFNRHQVDGLPDPDNIFARRAMASWWLYFGDIPPSKIIECLTEEAIPYRPAPRDAALS